MDRHRWYSEMACVLLSYMTAYTGEELDKQLTQLRTSLQQKPASDENVLKRVRSSMYQSAMQAVVGVADVYLDARKSLEDQVRVRRLPLENSVTGHPA